MTPKTILLPAVGAALLLSAGAASASDYGYGYSHRARVITTWRPETRYVRRTVVVPVRVWRPVRHRIVAHRTYYRPTYYREAYARPVYVETPGYAYGYGHDWERYHEHRRWEHERWEHRW